MGETDCSDPAAPVGAWEEFKVVGYLLAVVGGVIMAPGWEQWARIWLPAVGAAMPAGAHAATIWPGIVGQGATAGPAHWFPRSTCWLHGMVVGEYGGEEYGEPPTGCIGNMERIWEVESDGCGDSEREEDKCNGTLKLLWLYNYMMFVQIPEPKTCQLYNIFVQPTCQTELWHWSDWCA